MRNDTDVLFEQFVEARCVAVLLTDHYRETRASDADRAELWDSVIRQTEAARMLLESWLQSGKLADRAPMPSLTAALSANGTQVRT